MYNIKQAAARAGVTVPVLRAWERRYGIVRPARTASGYRQFDAESVARIRIMRGLVDDGWSPKAAAAAILAGQIPVTITADPDAAGGAGASSISSNEPTEITERFVDAARRLDSGALAAVLDDVFARGSFERVVSDLLFPALHRLGDAWQNGDVSIAGEHLASNAVRHRLGQALEAAGSVAAGPAGGAGIVVGLPPGGRHELGALAFAVAARRAGLRVSYLGADLPIDDWVIAARTATGAVIGAAILRDRSAALVVADRLRATRPDLVIAFGGRSAPTRSAFLRLPDELTESVAAIRSAMAAGAVSPA